MQDNKELGKLIAVHGTSPHLLQRAGVVSVLSFAFFLSLLVSFYVFRAFVLFLLSTGFLIVYVFTMIGWWMQRRNVAEIYENGILFRDRRLIWNEIKAIEFNASNDLSIMTDSPDPIVLPHSIYRLDAVGTFIRNHIE